MSEQLPIRTLISPARYVQARGAISRLGEFVRPIGASPLVIADDVVWGLVGAQVTSSFAAAGLPVVRQGVGTYATAAQVDQIAAQITATGADVVVAVGGRSAIDAVKAAGFVAGIRWVSVPTVASTDAPRSTPPARRST